MEAVYVCWWYSQEYSFSACFGWLTKQFPSLGEDDDQAYYTVSKRSFNSVSDWFDLQQFKETS